MTRPDPGVELLERALGYTRVALLHVRPDDLHRPTPCAGWTLDRLLDHMVDALEAFAEGADGAIALDPGPRGLDVRVAHLQTLACELLGAWSAPDAPASVAVGGLPVPTPVVVRAAALEITVHGWDVARATGRDAPVPAELARALHPVATALVDDADRGERFAAALPVPPYADPERRLLAHLGRDLTGPVAQVSRNRGTTRRPAS